jgi:hypothetical protein
MKIRPLLCILFLLVQTQAGAEIYQTRDEQGNIIYTDVPPKEGAPEVKLPPVNVFEAPDPFEFPRKTSNSTAGEFKYHKLEIVSPANNETIFINASNIAIEIKLLPGINRSAGHRLEILWDGQLLAQNQLSYQIAEAERGEHLIEARVVDKDGQALLSATPVTVHVKQPFVKP